MLPAIVGFGIAICKELCFSRLARSQTPKYLIIMFLALGNFAYSTLFVYAMYMAVRPDLLDRSLWKNLNLART